MRSGTPFKATSTCTNAQSPCSSSPPSGMFRGSGLPCASGNSSPGPLRSGPGEEFPEAQGSPLPRNIPLGGLEEQGDWAFVHVLVALNGVPDRMAWIAKDKIEMDTLKLRHYHPPANAN